MTNDVDVQRTMLSLELTLERTHPAGTVIFDGTDPHMFGAGNLRRAAVISTEFNSGSDRPVIGPAIRHAKRLVRRGLRWYVAALFDQQSRFNNQLVDAVEQLSVRQEHLVSVIGELERLTQLQCDEIARLRGDLPGSDQPGRDLPGRDLPGDDLQGDDLPARDLRSRVEPGGEEPAATTAPAPGTGP
jgi:hypothetical protein